jgi:hypothetical protein
MNSKPRLLLTLVACFSLATAVGAQSIQNWAAPPSWSPARDLSSSKGLMDLTNPLPFIPITPCRIADTRGNGFTGQYGPPKLTQGTPRSFTLTGQCGIPGLAGAVSLNITVTGTAGPGFILIYPEGGSQPLVSTLNYVANQTIANAAVVPLGSDGMGGGGITVVAGVHDTQLIIDTNGYYSPTPASSSGYFGIITDHPGGGVIYGANSDLLTAASIGVRGQSFSSGTGSAGVKGEEFAASGLNYGVLGETSTSFLDSAGVKGIDGSGVPGGGATGFIQAGVRGDSKNHVGVFGLSELAGVGGFHIDSSGSILEDGWLGYNGYGVYSDGDFGGTGAKYFIEPHPLDASKVIKYVALEGPEAGTYFRGTARTVDGEATIQVPESFRMVTSENGLTVQATPVGDVAAMGVMSENLYQIVVRASKDVTFHYLVQGVRRGYEDFQPVQNGEEFMPRGPSDRIPAYLNPEQRRKVVANGTYNPDGTVNMQTAEREGWTAIWRQRREREEASAAAHRAKMTRDKRGLIAPANP